MQSARLRWCVAVLVVLAWGCEDRVNYSNTTGAPGDVPAEVDVDQLASDLTRATWRLSEISAAPCAQRDYAWQFALGGEVEFTRSGSSYDEDANCVSTSTTYAGQATIDAAGVMRVDFEDGLKDVAWQVAVFESMPQAQYSDGVVEYTLVEDVLTTQAYVAASGDGRVFTRDIVTSGYGTQSNALKTTLTFDAPLELGPCAASVSHVARTIEGEEPGSEASEAFEIRCAVEDIGLEGWKAVRLVEDMDFEPFDDRTAAEAIIDGQRWDYEYEDKVLFLFHDSPGARPVLVHPYSSCCDERWWTGR